MKVSLDTLKFVSLMDELARRTANGFTPKRKITPDNAGKVWKERVVFDDKSGMDVFYPLMWESDFSGSHYKRDVGGRTVGECLGRDFDVTVCRDEDGYYIAVLFLNDNSCNGETSSITIRDGVWNFTGTYFNN